MKEFVSGSHIQRNVNWRWWWHSGEKSSKDRTGRNWEAPCGKRNVKRITAHGKGGRKSREVRKHDDPKEVIWNDMASPTGTQKGPAYSRTIDQSRETEFRDESKG